MPILSREVEPETAGTTRGRLARAIVIVVIVVGTVITAKSESVWIGEGTRGIGKIGRMRHRTSGSKGGGNVRKERGKR
jgi:hypothetical protein